MRSCCDGVWELLWWPVGRVVVIMELLWVCECVEWWCVGDG